MKKKSNISNAFWLFFLMFINFQLLLSYTSDTTNSYKYQFGLLIGARSIEHSTHLPIIMDNSICGTFSAGLSFGKNVGLTLAYEYIPDLLYFDSKIIFSNFDASFSSTKSNFRVYNPIKKEYEDVYLKYSFNSNITTFSLQPSIYLQPIKKIPFRVRLSADISNPLSIPEYRTNEEIISPRIFTFPDQTQNHIIDNGNLNQLGTSYSAIAGLQFERQIKSRLFLALEVCYQHPLNSLTKNFKWEATQYCLNLILSYGFNSLFPAQSEKQESPIPMEEPKEVQEILVQNTEEVKNETTLTITAETIDLLETTVTEAYPLLPYIFFEERSKKIENKYISNLDKNFDETSLPHNSIEIYYKILDIVGKRLKENKKAIITIAGHSDGKEFPTKEERENLALSRANEVKNYLINKWGVNKNQINVEFNDIPVLATSNLYNEGPSENRRVEIKSNDNLLLKPILLTKFREYKILSDSITIYLNSNNIDKIDVIDYKLSGKEIKEYTKNTNSTIKIKINKELADIILQNIENSENIVLESNYRANDSLKKITIPISHKIEYNTFEYQRLNLIVFDFDKYQINEANMMILNDFVAKSIQENSEVRIIGSTDILGTKEYNLQLSKQRANSTKNILLKLKPKANFVEVQGIGDSNLKYDNTTPEGRFYSRTVLIEVKTPINNK